MALEEMRSKSSISSRVEQLDAALRGLGQPRELCDLVEELLARQLAVTRAVAGIVLLRSADGASLELAASSGYDSADLDGWQRSSIDQPFPLHDAVREDRVVLVSSLAELRARYPHVTPFDDQPHALAGLPLRGADGGVLGGVGLRFDLDGDGIDLSEDVLAGEVLSLVAGSRLGHDRVVRPLQERVDQLQLALDSRIVIEQAKGMLAERHRIGLDEAFERLRRHARSHGERAHDVAAAVLAGELHL